MSSFTPGPWAPVATEASFAIMAGDYPRVGYVHHNAGHEHETAANARLIAASPDLLAALRQAAMELGEAASIISAHYPNAATIFVKAAERARDVVAKAEAQS